MTQYDSVLTQLQSLRSWLDEAIAYAEAADLAFTRYYTYLVRKRWVIARAIRKIEKLTRKYNY